jgi:hypothetical protein
MADKCLRNTAAGDTSDIHTIEDFKRWLDEHAPDIFVGPPLYTRTLSLAELAKVAPQVAVDVHRTFLRRWFEHRWFPSRLSIIEAALDDGQPVSYVGPCRFCAADIRARLGAQGMVCPSCQRVLVAYK